MPSSGDNQTLMGRTLDPSPQVEKILEDRPPPPVGDQQPDLFERLTRAVLFSDIVGSTAYFETRGDDAGMAMVERHNQLLFPEVANHQGSIIKTIGDAIMAAYPTALDAVQSAVAMQEALKTFNASEKSEDRISVRIGVNYGQVILREQDLFGDVVNAAARVEALATGGKVLISSTALEQLPEDFGLPCLSFDAVRVKGKLEPIEVFEVRWDPDAPLTPAGVPALPDPGDVLGDRFEIISMLGAGGMGQVFEARDRALEELVALKFIHAKLARDPETMARFKQEVKLARSVTHRNICRIHEFLQTERHTFLSMELLRGTTLTELIARQAPLSAGRAVEIVAGICSGLSEAHDRRITHRDLKPSNVMIEDLTGRVVIMDFGIAQLASARRAADEGEMIGTPAYMSPEQARGETVGPASDVYAVGAILYELLCGRPPHTAPTPVAMAVKQLTEEPERPRMLNQSIPLSLEEVVVKCLAKDADRRYPDAGKLANALAPEQPDTVRLPLKRRRRNWIGAVIGLAVLLAGFSLFWPSSEPPAPAGPVRHLVSSKAVEHNGRWSPDGRFVGFLRDGDAWVTAYPTIKLIRSTTGAAAVAPIEPAGLSWSTDGNELLFPGMADTGLSLFRVPAFGGSPVPSLPEAVSADMSPDGKLLAFTERISAGCFGVAIARPDGSEKLSLLTGDASVSYLRPRWSPDGTRLALVLHFTGFNSTRDIGVYELKSRKRTILTRDGKIEKAFNTDPTWSPDGKWILYASKRTGTMSLWTVPARGGESTPFTQGATEDQRGPSVSSDGAVLFNTTSRRLDISIVRPDQKEPIPVTQDVWTDRFPVWSPNGSQIAFRSQRNSNDLSQRLIVIHDLQDDAEEDLPGPAGLRDFAWCGNGNLVYAATVGQTRRLGLLELDSGNSRLLADEFFRIWSPSADSSCQRVFFSGQKQSSDPRRLWWVDVAGKDDPVELDQNPGRQTFPSFSPDGTRIAYRWAPSEEKLAEAELRIYSTRTKKHPLVTRHASFGNSRRRIHWSADGQHLFYMEATGLGGTLWKVALDNPRPRPIQDLKDIHTFDYDLSPDGQSIVYPRESRSGDLFVLEDVQW